MTLPLQQEVARRCWWLAAETNTLLPLPLLLLLLDTRTVDNTTIINAHMNITHR